MPCMFHFVLKDGGDTLVPKVLLDKLDLFKENPKLLQENKYRIASDVSLDDFGFFLLRLYGAETDENVANFNPQALRALCDELGFNGFDAELSVVMSTNVPREFLRLRDRVDRHDVLFEELRRQVFELARRLETQSANSCDDEKVDGKLEVVRRECQRHQDEAIASVRKDLSRMARREDVESLRSEVSRLKENERRREPEQRQAPPPPPPSPPKPTPVTSKPTPVPSKPTKPKIVPPRPQVAGDIERPYEGKALNGIIAYLTRESD